MISLKAGVRVLGLRPELLLALMVAEPLWTQQGAELVLTSGIEGTHTGAQSTTRGWPSTCA